MFRNLADTIASPDVFFTSFHGSQYLQWVGLTLLGPQCRFGGKLLGICLVCPQNGTAVHEGLT